MIKNDYRRALIMLRPNVQGYSGHVRLERRTLMGSMYFIVNTPDSLGQLQAALVGKNNGEYFAITLGTLRRDGRGQANLAYSFDPRDIVGRPLEDYQLVAIVRIDGDQCELVLTGNVNGSCEVTYSAVRDVVCALYGPASALPERPNTPVQPSRPVPSQPSTPVQPSRPVPSQPSTPVQPSRPVPSQPSTPVQPSRPVPSQPSTPVQPNVPARPISPVDQPMTLEEPPINQPMTLEEPPIAPTTRGAEEVPADDLPAPEAVETPVAETAEESNATIDGASEGQPEQEQSMTSTVETSQMDPEVISGPKTRIFTTMSMPTASEISAGVAQPETDQKSAAEQLGIDASLPWTPVLEPLRDLFQTQGAGQMPFEDPYVYVQAPMPEGSGFTHCMIGLQAGENGINSVRYALPARFTAEQPAGLEDYVWVGGPTEGWWVFTADPLTGMAQDIAKSV